MALGSITYTSVSWASGDIITEAKLDNMVANDQAYDAHAAQGHLLNNNVGYYQKDSGGTNRQLLNLDTSNLLQLGATGITAIVFNNTPRTDAIAEKTTAAGVTIDGVLIKDTLDVSGIVAKTGNQTIAGEKTFSNILKVASGIQLDGGSVTRPNGAFYLPSLGSDPASPENGMMYYSTSTGTIRIYTDDTWKSVTAS